MVTYFSLCFKSSFLECMKVYFQSTKFEKFRDVELEMALVQ